MCSLSRLYTPSTGIDGYGGYLVDRETEELFLTYFLSLKAVYAVFICVLIRPEILPLSFGVGAYIAFWYGFSPGFEDGLCNGNIIFMGNFNIRGVGFHD